MKKRSILFILILLFSMAVPVSAVKTHTIPITLSHLNFLTESVKMDGEDMLITHIYSEYPDYKWVDASGEGIACVDDVARAAIVYLTDYEQSHHPDSLARAKKALNFVMHMQASDGEFYNFINKDLSINKTGSTSKKSFDWWAARGMWALGYGYKVFSKMDPAYAQKINEHFLLANQALQKKISPNYGKFTILHGYKVPAWIDGFDAMSNALLGLSEYYAVSPKKEIKNSMTMLGNGLSAFQYGSYSDYPFSAHLDWNGSPTLWHAWGSAQAFALAKAGTVLKKPEWVQSAKEEADHLFTHILANGMIKEMAPTPSKDEQIAYGVNMLVQSFSQIYQATHDKTYAKYAGLAASWFTGNNDANFVMYDPETGRGYDGLNGDTKKVNQNSGAESTIEALMAMQKINQLPEAVNYLYSKTNSRNGTRIMEAENFTAATGNPAVINPESQWTGDASYSGKIVSLFPGDSLKTKIRSKQNEAVLLYAAAEKTALPKGKITLEITVNDKITRKSAISYNGDSNYLTLIKLEKPVPLTKGENSIEVKVKGEQKEKVILDNIVIQPVEESAVFTLQNGKIVKLERNFSKERNTLTESRFN
ncbi:hypothetical protein [Metabacillus sp. RGM 3146]|uniref:hypothetical protein n=1 Tax=Metabacillus sp. RGM 3146 TaxID=3401092 RepID=UPI003B9D7FBC